jgi:hypothetical protein
MIKDIITTEQLILALQQLPQDWKVYGVINNEQFEITNVFVIDENEIGLTINHE